MRLFSTRNWRTLLVVIAVGLYFSVYRTNIGDSIWYGKRNKILAEELGARQSGYNETKFRGTKNILLWTNYFSKTDYYFGLGSKGFKKHRCEYSNCFITYNRSKVPIDEFDAIVFHSPNISKSGKLEIKARSPYQRYVFFSLESPNHWPANHEYTIYNWTATYRKDADIYIPYGEVQLKLGSDKAYVSNVSVFYKKTKWVAWFASNCHTESQREKYVQLLQQFIPVDIYGKCGNNTCKRGETKCNDILERDYRFYLSFENTICTEYVSEKLFRTMKYNIVPVVYGGADYANMLPPVSYVNAMDYKPKALAEELYRIGNDSSVYMDYLDWKKNYTVKGLGLERTLFCNLCKKLHEDHVEKYYTNLKKTWTDGMCWKPNISLFS